MINVEMIGLLLMLRLEMRSSTIVSSAASRSSDRPPSRIANIRLLSKSKAKGEKSA